MHYSFGFKDFFPPDNSIAIIDSNIPAIYTSVIKNHISRIITIQGGERCKTRWHKAYIEDQLFQKGCNKETLLIAVGGGSLLDLVGFTAATFMRGIRLWFVPTTLLAMIDASIGGKNGVNTEYAKNCLGTIYEPEKIYIDMRFLEALPEEKLRKDCVEGLKHSFLGRFPFEGVSLLQEPEKLQQFVKQNIQFKSYVVEQDKSWPGYRDILNFGHTFGHALETLEGYTMDHSTAVAIGLQAEVALGHLLPDVIDGMRATIDALEIDIRIARPYSYNEWHNALHFDKKTKGGKLHCVLFARDGSILQSNGAFSHLISEEQIRTTIDWIHERCCRK